MIRTTSLFFPITIIALLVFLFVEGCSTAAEPDREISFNGQRALDDIKFQVSQGPRVPGSAGHDSVKEWIAAELSASGWNVFQQNAVSYSQPVSNIIGKYGSGYPLVIIGTHYDTRFFADQDPMIENRALPVPGANDGASGVAVLNELARILPVMMENDAGNGTELWFNQIWLVYFDGEDNGNIPGYDWALGSQAFVNELTESPDAVVIVDMIGDSNLNICYEGNSDSIIQDQIFQTASLLGYEDKFDSSDVCHIRDDHTAFIEAGIPAALLIDFDYPYWHTVDDTLDKVSADSLKVVGDTIITWFQR